MSAGDVTEPLRTPSGFHLFKLNEVRGTQQQAVVQQVHPRHILLQTNELEDDQTVWEQAPLNKLAETGELMAYEHHGFWQPMDTLRDRNLLEKLWKSGNAPWQVWQQDPA